MSRKVPVALTIATALSMAPSASWSRSGSGGVRPCDLSGVNPIRVPSPGWLELKVA
jgi:hypothetical protein